MENNMTNIERKLMQEEKSFSSLKRLAERTRKIIEDHITERIEDHYFADSWEESSQISRDIELTADQDSANDLVQECMLKALDNKEKFVHAQNFKGWMYTIMRNLFINN